MRKYLELWCMFPWGHNYSQRRRLKPKSRHLCFSFPVMPSPRLMPFRKSSFQQPFLGLMAKGRDGKGGTWREEKDEEVDQRIERLRDLWPRRKERKVECLTGGGGVWVRMRMRRIGLLGKGPPRLWGESWTTEGVFLGSNVPPRMERPCKQHQKQKFSLVAD